MPFPVILGLDGTPQSILDEIDKRLREVISLTMDCPSSWVVPFFPADLRKNPGHTTIYVQLDTAMFYALVGDNNMAQSDREQMEEKVLEVLNAIATVIQEFLPQKEVEGWLGNFNPGFKVLLSPGVIPSES